MDNLQEVIEKMKLAQSLLKERAIFLSVKSRDMYRVGFVTMGQDLDAAIHDLEFVVEDLGKAIHLAITHNIKN